MNHVALEEHIKDLEKSCILLSKSKAELNDLCEKLQALILFHPEVTQLMMG
jgi:hypothetical protein